MVNNVSLFYNIRPNVELNGKILKLVMAEKHLGLNIFIDIQTSITLIQMDINKMVKKMEFISWFLCQ